MKSICVTKYIEVLNQFRVKNPDYATTLENVRKKYGAFYDTSDCLIAQNLNMGILSKLGGVPFAISNMKGNVDLYIGIDVGTATNGIHYPACSVAFTKDGSFLGFVQPVDAIPGEKIPPDVLRKLLTEILVAYREKYQEYPKSVVIHRDGFSHEDSSIYSDFFEKEGIKVSVFEIRKVGAPRIMNRNNQDGQNRNYKYAWNPVKGTLLFREDEAFLVTTEAKAGGAPKTIHIVKKYGDINIQTAAEQIYALTKIDASSIWDTRLPVTIKFADAVCKQRKYLPKGIVDNRLLFL